LDGDPAHQSSCAGIPQVDLLGPLGGEEHRGKGQGGNDQGGRHGDVLRSQGLYGKIKEKEAAMVLNRGIVLSIF